ncbi:protein RIC-3-like isoform X1 [Branchiostoma floridae]|uniref:Protein RIC-3-like isoform X1 n=1 Tax=Branchiostoma floridae TaxID=7739 RepID=A0A9J7KYA4_BRAFL|nr:protein RIC-3-like isoform X1 [Branchiostoma floridae]XP_035672733.1 protein RIC-3-like isoform X1 [Branchiostoma floridae]
MAEREYQRVPDRPAPVPQQGITGTQTIIVVCVCVLCIAMVLPRFLIPEAPAPPASQPFPGPHGKKRGGEGAHARAGLDPITRPGFGEQAFNEKRMMRASGGEAAPTQTQGRGWIGVALPMYTVGILIYFVYVIYKIFLKKKNEPSPRPQADSWRDRGFRDIDEANEANLLNRLSQGDPLQRKPNPMEGIDRGTTISELELRQLEMRLHETERLMNMMMEKMGDVSGKLQEEMVRYQEKYLSDQELNDLPEEDGSGEGGQEAPPGGEGGDVAEKVQVENVHASLETELRKRRGPGIEFSFTQPESDQGGVGDEDDPDNYDKDDPDNYDKYSGSLRVDRRGSEYEYEESVRSMEVQYDPDSEQSSVNESWDFTGELSAKDLEEIQEAVQDYLGEENLVMEGAEDGNVGPKLAEEVLQEFSRQDVWDSEEDAIEQDQAAADKDRDAEEDDNVQADEGLPNSVAADNGNIGGGGGEDIFGLGHVEDDDIYADEARIDDEDIPAHFQDSDDEEEEELPTKYRIHQDSIPEAERTDDRNVGTAENSSGPFHSTGTASDRANMNTWDCPEADNLLQDQDNNN